MGKVKKGQQLELEIEGIAFGGRGLARVDGLTVFVDQAVPQDRVLARISKRKQRYAEAYLLELINPSPFRVKAPCPYSGICGGCKWQFLSYPKQLEYKRRHVVEALEHIALINGTPVHPTLPSPQTFAYRNKMEFTCSDRRWLMPAEMGREDIDTTFALGLHVPGTFYKVLDTRICLLQPELGNQLLQTMRRYIQQSPAAVYGLHSHQGFWRFVVLRHSVAEQRWMVNLITSSEQPDLVMPLARQLQQRFPVVSAVVNNITARKAGVAVGEYEIPLAGATTIADRIGRYTFAISANSFFQTNTRGAHQLYDVTRQYAALSGSERVLDLYCGAGTIAISLAEAAKEVWGVEIVASAVSDARRNCHLNAVRNCHFVQGDIRRSLADLTVQAEVLIIDPPRAGMHPEVVRQILAMAPQRMVYVSCNPATMARDIALMHEYYRLVEVQPVDLFPHTYHVECVARLVQR